jgi:predicted dehydrogenase
MNRTVRIGAVGLGIAFRELHLPALSKFSEEIEIAGIAAASMASMERASSVIRDRLGYEPERFENLDDLLSRELDAVLVCVPIHLTAGVARKVLAAGHNLICEKPLAQSAAEAAELVAIAEAKDRLLAVCENFRYQEGFLAARRLVSDGVIGDLRGYFLNDLHYTAPDGMYAVTKWRTQGLHRGGYLLDGGTHIIAGLRAMMGDTPNLVHSLGASFHGAHLGRPYDTAFVNVGFPSGVTGHLTLGYGSPDREARHPKLLGTSGTLALFKDRIEIWRPDPAADELIPLKSQSSGISEEWCDFIPAVRGESTIQFSSWEAVLDLAVIDAILESVESGAPVAVDQYGPGRSPHL